MIKGWRKHLILNWQTKLLFYDISSESDQKSVWSPPSLIVDLADEEFDASAVTRTEAIHAKNKDLPNMFKVEIVVSCRAVPCRVCLMFHTLRSFISDLPDQSLVAETREKYLHSDRERIGKGSIRHDVLTTVCKDQEAQRKSSHRECCIEGSE